MPRAGSTRASHDKRGAERKTVLDRAVAFQNAPLRRFSCVLRDISATGARLVGADIDVIRARFVLTVQGETTEPRICQVVWRRHRTIGVRFVPRAKATKADTDTLDAARIDAAPPVPGRAHVTEATMADSATIIASVQSIAARLADDHAKTSEEILATRKPLRGMS